ncbi:unnamed protein product, partial [Closterium sp. NIES-53]
TFLSCVCTVTEVVSSPPTSCGTFFQSFALPDSPQQNGIAEHRIGLVMEVARSFMIHAAVPHFLWPFAVRYGVHQLNLWPRVSLPETSPTLRWTGEVGDASVFRIWGSRAFVRDTSADKCRSTDIGHPQCRSTDISAVIQTSSSLRREFWGLGGDGRGPRTKRAGAELGMSLSRCCSASSGGSCYGTCPSYCSCGTGCPLASLATTAAASAAATGTLALPSPAAAVTAHAAVVVTPPLLSSAVAATVPTAVAVAPPLPSPDSATATAPAAGAANVPSQTADAPPSPTGQDVAHGSGNIQRMV